jgi:cell division protein FtsQ
MVVLLLVLGLYGFLHSPFFTVESIQANGSSYAVETLAELAGIEKGTSLFRLDVDMAMRRLEQEPIISRAIVRRHLPDTVYIEVQERTPIAMVPSGSGFWGVAVDGTVLGRIDVGGISLPIISGVDSQTLVVGSSNVSELVMASSIIEGLPRAVRNSISEVNVRNRDGLKVISRNLVEFQLGGPGNLAQKLEVVAAFLPRLESVPLPAYTVIDVSNPKRPVVRKLR